MSLRWLIPHGCGEWLIWFGFLILGIILGIALGPSPP